MAFVKGVAHAFVVAFFAALLSIGTGVGDPDISAVFAVALLAVTRTYELSAPKGGA